MSMPLVGVVMGSSSDWEVMQHAAMLLQHFGIGYEARVVSAHRTPDLLYEYASSAEARGLKAIIAGAGGAAHLPGMLAAKTIVPILGVPVPTKYLKGMDSLLSIVQMPKVVLVEKNKNSALGLVFVFALTGWLGFTLGPVLNHYLKISGAEPILMALGGTALIFFGLSAYVLISKRDFTFATGFLMTGMMVAFVAAIANAFLQIQGLQLVVSGMFLLLSSGMIMWQTSQIVHGGERNYISATVTLYVMLYNLFSILLSFLGGSRE